MENKSKNIINEIFKNYSVIISILVLFIIFHCIPGHIARTVSIGTISKTQKKYAKHLKRFQLTEL